MKLYWSGIESPNIQRGNLDGTDMETVLQTPGGAVPDIAFDPIQRKMYWPSAEANGIQRSNYDGSDVETVIQTDDPWHVAIDATGGYAYWSEFIGAGSEIWRGKLDGSFKQMLTTTQSHVTSLEADPEGGYYYWSEFIDGTIHRATLDNQQATVIHDRRSLGRTGLYRGIAIDSENDVLYAVDPLYSAIVRMELDGSNPEVFLTEGVVNPYAIVIDPYHDRVIWSNQARSPQFPLDTNISSINFDGTEQRIDFQPLGRFDTISYVRHLALGPIEVPEPHALALIALVISSHLMRRSLQKCPTDSFAEDRLQNFRRQSSFLSLATNVAHYVL
ncbi:MAG: hypothetical protein WD851_06580 [Pirellulales bacterium]